ncbi:MAG: arsenate reductase family protein [Nitrospiria bacterium]
MPKPKIYQYERCSTCRKALKYLDLKGVAYQSVPIVERAPTKAELKIALKAFGGDLRRLFNTSGQVYREMQLSQKIKTMHVKEAIDLLNSNGKLVKRPFVLTDKGVLVGFKEAEWDRVFGS